MTETAGKGPGAELAERQTGGPVTAVEQLVAARQAAGLGASDIAAKLGMATRQVEALERGDWQALPGQAFVRGALRAYAKTVGASAEPLLASIGGQVQAPELRPSASLDAPMPRGGALGFGSGGSSGRLVWIVLGVVAVIAMALYSGGGFEIGEPDSAMAPGQDDRARVAQGNFASDTAAGRTAGAGAPGAGAAGAVSGASPGAPTGAAGALSGASPGAATGVATSQPVTGDAESAPGTALVPLQPLAPLAPSGAASRPAAGAPGTDAPAAANPALASAQGSGAADGSGGSSGSGTLQAAGGPGEAGRAAPGGTGSGAAAAGGGSAGRGASAGGGAAAPAGALAAGGGAAAGGAATAGPVASGSAPGPTAIAGPGAPPGAGGPVAGAPSTPASGTAAPGAAEEALRLRFRRAAWVDIRSADGTVLLSGLQAAGSSRELSGRRPFTLVIGNAAHVSVEAAGKPVDLAAHAPKGVARLTLE